MAQQAAAKRAAEQRAESEMFSRMDVSHAVYFGVTKLGMKYS